MSGIELKSPDSTHEFNALYPFHTPRTCSHAKVAHGDHECCVVEGRLWHKQMGEHRDHGKATLRFVKSKWVYVPVISVNQESRRGVRQAQEKERLLNQEPEEITIYNCLRESSVKFRLMMILTGAFFVVELVTGVGIGSLALVTDAYHMLSDLVALIIGLYASWALMEGADQVYTYGKQRAELVGALVNAASLVALCIQLSIQSLSRFIDYATYTGGGSPCQELQNSSMLFILVAALGLCFNILGLFIFTGCDCFSPVEDDHGHSHGGDDHGHSNGGDDHGHSHGGKQCTGHGPAKQASHEHSHSTKPDHGHSHDVAPAHGHSHSTGSNHGHSHGGKACTGHGEAKKPNMTTNTDHGHSHSTKPDHGHSHDVAPAHGHSHSAKVDHGHSHALTPALGHSHSAKVDHGHSHAVAPAHEHSHSTGLNHGHSHGGKACTGHEEAKKPIMPTKSDIGHSYVAAPSSEHSHSFYEKPVKKVRKKKTADEDDHGHSHAGGGGHSHADMNVQAMLLHVAGDALGSIAALFAGCLIMFVEASWACYADPAMSLFITILILIGTTPLLISSAKQLLDKVPDDIELEDLLDDLFQVHGVHGIHDLHIWARTHAVVVGTVHVSVEEGTFIGPLMDEIKHIMHEHGVHNSTVQIELVNLSKIGGGTIFCTDPVCDDDAIGMRLCCESSYSSVRSSTQI
eukprot:CAMPEP_0196573400 /NCGR_PEP_ID=MMETSP1081-20130531/3307_1 /TAXON_ID=36882 /ORGANISM="Pyramimonas amylifera, Strain CCMP720" /LENGTH=685 /DNA_ID=CAMNT_0041891089 /DNA_START=181 /DNA_END=2238 /DNA_ORIENTATION=+